MMTEQEDSTFKVALFDLDGTLINTEGQYTVFWDGVVRDLHIDIPDFSNLIKGTTLKGMFEKYIPSLAMRREITERMNAFEAQMDFPFFPGALEFIADIRKHDVKCAVVTSSNQCKMASLRRKLPDFDRLFDRVLTAEDFAASKPAPDCYLLGARVFNQSLKNCVVFEDALNGLEAGVSAGIFTIGFATGNPRSMIVSRCHHVEDDFLQLSYDKVNFLLCAHNAAESGQKNAGNRP